MRKLSAGLAVVTLALGGVTVLGTSAQAATGTCNNRMAMVGYLGGGVDGLADIPTRGRDTTCVLPVGTRTGTSSPSPVFVLQYNLRMCYGQTLVLDGVYGARTAAAVKAAQSTVPGLPRDGVYGPQTRSALRWVTESTGAHGVVTRACLPFSSLR